MYYEIYLKLYMLYKVRSWQSGHFSVYDGHNLLWGVSITVWPGNHEALKLQIKKVFIYLYWFIIIILLKHFQSVFWQKCVYNIN